MPTKKPEILPIPQSSTIWYNKDMKIYGDKIFAKDAQGKLLSRIGTMFFKTMGLVTKRGVHAMQRLMWLEEVNKMRAAQGLKPMTPTEEDEEIGQSVDLLFTNDHVLIRPDPDRMDLAFKADEELQKMVSKRKIRFLNTHSIKVRNALRARGENWRMARQPISQDDMKKMIEESIVSLDSKAQFHYNHLTGTRYFTAGEYEKVLKLNPAECRAALKELSVLLSRRNRLGHPEADLFPTSTPIEIKEAFKNLQLDALGDDELKAKTEEIDRSWRLNLPANLREESVDNFEWRNAICAALSGGPNETGVDDSDILQGISPEFYRQIEWLPGARIEDGEVIFDALWDEYNRTRDPELADVCDQRVRSFLFNLSRLFSDVEFVNVGRISHSLARTPIAGARRGNVYIFQYKEERRPQIQVYIVRFQKWGIAEHLDEGKDLLTSILQANEYTDYILDRRLMCRQLGMALPHRIGLGKLTEPYRGQNQYKGTVVRTTYFLRGYVSGIASDKVPPAKFRNPAFAYRFAELMGEAAAVDLVVGRRATETGEYLFDKKYEIIQLGADGLPVSLMVTDHSGSFVNYLHEFEDYVPSYANVIRRRKSFVADVEGFAAAYVASFKKKLYEVQERYRSHRTAFDELFMHRAYDIAGSGAFRWAKTLERLDKCDPEHIAKCLEEAIHLQ